jgi:hypothetical protein
LETGSTSEKSTCSTKVEPRAGPVSVIGAFTFGGQAAAPPYLVLRRAARKGEAHVMTRPPFGRISAPEGRLRT